jgi:hypothetical protein
MASSFGDVISPPLKPTLIGKVERDAALLGISLLI